MDAHRVFLPWPLLPATEKCVENSGPPRARQEIPARCHSNFRNFRTRY
jgi:hypothetical protein